MQQNYTTGVLITILGAILWGVMGSASEFIQQSRGVTVSFLISSRLLTGGAGIVLFLYMRNKKVLLSLWRNKADVWDTAVFGLFGLVLCQYAYMRAIFYAGAGIATVLQYLAPVLIIFYMFFIHHKKPNIVEVVGIFIAIIGLLCIVFKSGLTIAGIDERVIFYGLLSAVGVAIYSMYPVRLLKKYGTLPVVSTGMLIGGFFYTLLFTPLEIPGTWDGLTYLAISYIVIFGTAIAFSLYLEGVRMIGAVKGSVLSALEPVAAAFFSWALLGTTFSFMELLGFTLILSTIFILALGKNNS